MLLPQKNCELGYYVNVYDAENFCGEDYVCYDYYNGWYCCDLWYSTGWAIALWVVLGLIILGCLIALAKKYYSNLPD